MFQYTCLPNGLAPAPSIISIREVAQVIGLLVSSLPVVKYGPLYYRSLKIDKNRALRQNNGNYEATIRPSPPNLSVTSLPTACKNITMGNPAIEMATDAPALGWGTVCNGYSVQGM